MTREDWEQWKCDSWDSFEALYDELNENLEEKGKITKRSKLTSLLYLFQNCNPDAGGIMYRRIADDTSNNNALAYYLLGHIFMYGYRGITQGDRDLDLAREYFNEAHELNPSFVNKQNP